MKNIFIVTTLMIIAVSGCIKKTGDKPVEPGFQHFKISIEQDNLVKGINNNEVLLEKKPFTIVISFLLPDRIFVNASYAPDSYNKAGMGMEVSELIGFKNTEIPEELFNKEDVLMISNKSPNYWYYANKNEHRFSEVIKKGGVLICSRKISNVLVFDKLKKKIAVTKITADTIYLVFMKLEWNDDYSKKIEKKRELIKLIFK